MLDIFKQYKKSDELHHFHICIGDKEQITSDLKNFCDEIFEYNFDRLLIDQVREIRNRAQIKTATGKKTFFAISFSSVTKEAQNAFLKIIEEPPTNTFFFFIVPRKDIFLLTVLSRAVITFLSVSPDEVSKNQNLLHELMDKNLGERIAWADDLAMKIKDEKLEKSVARGMVKQILFELETELSNSSPAARFRSTKPDSRAIKAKIAESLKKLQKIDDYLSDNSASIKILLEKAVLSLPE